MPPAPDAAGAVFLTLKMLCPWISDWTCWKKYKSDDEEKMLLRVLCTYRINSPHALVKMISTFCDSYDEMLDLIVLGQALKNPRSSVTLNSWMDEKLDNKMEAFSSVNRFLRDMVDKAETKILRLEEQNAELRSKLELELKTQIDKTEAKNEQMLQQFLKIQSS